MLLADADLVPIAEAPHLVPGNPSLATLRRWQLDGVLSARGERIKLQTTRIGGRVYVSRRAIDEFLQALNDGAGGGDG